LQKKKKDTSKRIGPGEKGTRKIKEAERLAMQKVKDPSPASYRK